MHSERVSLWCGKKQAEVDLKAKNQAETGPGTMKAKDAKEAEEEDKKKDEDKAEHTEAQLTNEAL